jgi:hypothetical protein
MSIPPAASTALSRTSTAKPKGSPSPAAAAPSDDASSSWLTRLGDSLFHALSPGVFTGITLGDWLRLLAENRFRIEPNYWPKAAFTTGVSVLNSCFAVAEQLAYGRRVAATDVPPPLFVLGHWRSGTTHLHNLLATDERYASPRFSQVMIPWTFLVGEPILETITQVLLPKTRFGIDNVSFGAHAPSEEEFALAQMTFRSPYVAWAFPRHGSYYDRYITFRGVPEDEVAEWKAAFVMLLKKLTMNDGRPTIIKSPPNTGRIRMLLEIFPGAKFVHIHRDPYTVYQSTRHLHVSSWKNFAFQKPDEDELRERILRSYVEMMDAFFEERSLIPEGHFAEISFNDLESDPLGQIEQIYRQLELPEFGVVRPRLEEYVRSLAGYRKNKHVELPADLRERIGREWQRSFEEWGYPL